ncbi:MAG: NfeD family protein [Mycobacteriales bacterium]
MTSTSARSCRDAPGARRALVVSALLTALCALLGTPAVAGGEEPSPGPRVLVTEVRTAITPVVADQVHSGLARASSDGFDAYVLELDTPGGLVTSTRNIVEDVLASPIPVVVYVSPQGARAASAGAIITLSAHVAVMAPGTSIGAATPVGMEGEEVSDKIVNDIAAQAEALAQLRGRNADAAVDMVRDGRSLAVEQAVELEIVDAVAPSLEVALATADGLRTTVAPQQEVTVRTAGAEVVRHDMGTIRRILQALADPNIAFLLLTLGTLGLIYELASPGVGVAGATGAIALLLALFSLSVLPVNVVGLLLLAVAAALLVAELFAPGVGGFAFGGAVVLVLAAMFLFDDAEGVSVDLMAVLPTAVLAAAAAVLAGRLVVRTRRQPAASSSADLLTGQTLTVRSVDPDGGTGRAFAEGAWWTVRSTGPPLAVGDDVRVRELDELVLVVDPLQAKEQQT